MVGHFKISNRSNFPYTDYTRRKKKTEDEYTKQIVPETYLKKEKKQILKVPNLLIILY